ncbi:endodeoxyribonuclease [Mitosporidium daphniae]
MNKAEHLNVYDNLLAMLRHVEYAMLNGCIPLPLILTDRKRSLIFDFTGRKFTLLKPPIYKRVCYGPKNQMKHYLAIIQILVIVVELIENSQFATKRDVFYRNVPLFERPSMAYDAIDDIACSLGVSREDLHIISSPKGLVFGDLHFTLRNNTDLKCDSQPLFIPTVSCIANFYLKNVCFVLLIEKESVFRSIVDCSSVIKRSVGNFVAITGKGYPCVSTRQFLRLLSLKYPNIPIFGLFDCDPYGMDIYYVYKYGSRNLSYESDSSVISSIQLLGLSINQAQEISKELDNLDYMFMSLSKRDYKKLLMLLEFSFSVSEYSMM